LLAGAAVHAALPKASSNTLKIAISLLMLAPFIIEKSIWKCVKVFQRAMKKGAAQATPFPLLMFSLQKNWPIR
jgi:hypothetical protein